MSIMGKYENQSKTGKLGVNPIGIIEKTDLGEFLNTL